MTDRDLLEQILSKIDNIENEMSDMKTKINKVENEVSDMKTEMSDMKTEMSDMKTKVNKIDKIENEIRRINLHLENGTDKNIQLIAENFVTLTNKLNQAIPIADKNLAYEVKVNYAIDEINKLKDEFEKFKSQIALTA